MGNRFDAVRLFLGITSAGTGQFTQLGKGLVQKLAGTLMQRRRAHLGMVKTEGRIGGL